MNPCVINPAMVQVAHAVAVGVAHKLGFKLGKVLGCGDQGCVFAAGAGRVAKVTASFEEANLAQLVAREPAPYVHLPKIWGVWQLPGRVTTHGTEGTWLIVREALPDARFEKPEAAERAQGAFERVARLVLHGSTPELLTRAAQYARAVLTTRDAWFADWLVGMHAWALSRKVWLRDLNPPNIGRRPNGEHVLRDVGGGESPRQPPAPLLSGAWGWR